ncbi:MAG: fibronectin [Actinobacteria bacterium]|nr:fibronectin [Actinomycetota bacterium]
MWGRFSKNKAKTSIALLSAALISSMLVAPSAEAQVRVRPSTVWGHTVAGNSAPAANATVSKSSPSSNIEKISKFVITYNSFPNWARSEVQAALDTWALNFKSSVDINVNATWSKSANDDVLGSARPGSYFADFTGAPDSTLWYPSALANSLAGKDLDRDNPEIIIHVNSSANWNQRGDDKPSNIEFDLESVILHEVAHGLGFLSTNVYDKLFDYGSIDQPTPFDAYIQTPDGRRLADMPSPSSELGKTLISPLYWIGENGKRVNGGEKIKLYTPTIYDAGSSISHLDETTYTKSGLDSVMTPNLEAGEVFHQPGPLLLAMMEDLRAKPPVGLAVSIPDAPRNVEALIGNQSAIITFDLPANARAAQVTSYTVKNLKTSLTVTGTSSPIIITGLKNGTSYTFAVTAQNSLGTSIEAITNPIIPQAGWKLGPANLTTDGRDLASTTFNGKPIIVFTQAAKGDLMLATWNGSYWSKSTIDGAGGSAGRTRNNIAGNISLCKSGTGTNQQLHIFYSDSKDLDLRHALYDGKTFTFEVVDGNGPTIQSYEIPDRVRTASDVSISNACAITPSGISVFYRDETQGVLLGATKRVNTTKWVYELIDGDRKTDNRTTGDVAFHLAAYVSGSTTHIVYDSVLVINQKREVTSGEVRYATRNGASPNSWIYQTLDESNKETPIAGFGVAIAKEKAGVRLVWIASSPTSTSTPNQIRSAFVGKTKEIYPVSTVGFGTPGSHLTLENGELIFNCEFRLCAVNLNQTSGQIRLVTSVQTTEPGRGVFVTVDKKRYLLAALDRKIAFFVG